MILCEYACFRLGKKKSRAREHQVGSLALASRFVSRTLAAEAAFRAATSVAAGSNPVAIIFGDLQDYLVEFSKIFQKFAKFLKISKKFRKFLQILQNFGEFRFLKISLNFH